MSNTIVHIDITCAGPRGRVEDKVGLYGQEILSKASGVMAAFGLNPGEGRVYIDPADEMRDQYTKEGTGE